MMDLLSSTRASDPSAEDRTPPALRHFAAFVLLVSALGSLPRIVELGDLGTGLTALTAMMLWMALLFLGTRPYVNAGVARIHRAWLLIAAWILLRALTGTVSAEGIQNAIIWALFLVAIAITSAARWDARSLQYLDTTARVATFVAGLSYLATIPIWGFGNDVVFGPRTTSMFLLVMLAWHLGYGLRKGQSRLWEVTLTLMILALSLSRMATVVGIILVSIGSWQYQDRLKSVVKVVLFAAIPLVIAIFALQLSPALSDAVLGRTFEGDRGLVLEGVAVNTSGRMNWWSTVLASSVERPFVGQGPGSAAAALQQAFGDSARGHPHNDYLRLLHDYGIVGLLLFVGGAVRSARAALVAGRRGSEPRRLYSRRALLLLLVLCAMMLTDNPLAYYFVMAPLGVLLGVAQQRCNSTT